MSGLEKTLKKTIEQLEQYENNAKKQLTKLPKDKNLITSKRKNGWQFYEEKGGKKKYIPITDHLRIHDLAQKEYLKRLLRYTNRVLPKLEALAKIYRDDGAAAAFFGMHEAKRSFVTPLTPNPLGWEKEAYRRNSMGDAPNYMTEKGFAVRSKGEKIIVDLLAKNNIPVRYEPELFLKGYGVVYPDFEVMNPRTGEIFLWEHLGMLNDAGYRARNAEKIKRYNANGYYINVNLIVSQEWGEGTLDLEDIQAKIDRFLK